MVVESARVNECGQCAVPGGAFHKLGGTDVCVCVEIGHHQGCAPVGATEDG
eukprot:COSAG02_NODE_2576_length_8498_cov_4.245386_2_plen_51_part_00